MSKIVDLTGLSRFWANVDKKKASIDGTYPNLVSGDLAGRGESVPASFGFRASGGKSIKDGRAYIKRIKGNSVVWNQLLLNSTNIATSSGSKALNEGTSIVAGHKYLLFADFDGGTDYASASLFTKVNGESKSIFSLANNEGKTYKFVTAEIGGISNGTAADVEGNIWQYFYFVGTTESITNTRLIDLTQMFQAGNEPSTIEEFNARVATLGIDLNAYNEGEVIHCNTESIKSVGDNAWDEEWESGIISYNSGIETNSANHCRTVGYTQVIPNEQYYISFPTASATSSLVVICYDENKAFIKHIGGGSANKTFTIPANCHYIRFTWEGTEYNNNIMLTLVHSGWKQDTDAGYQPYWQDTLPLPIISKYFPDGMKLAGSAHDEIRYNKASGKWEYSKGKIKSVDMGTLNWGLTQQMYFRANLPSDSIIPTSVNYNGFLCAKYERVNFNLIYGQSVTTPCFGVSANNGMIGVYDSAYTDVASFKAAMAGVILYYEAEDWEWVELDEADQNFRDYYNVADFGTEMSQSAVPSAAFSADIIYQFNAVDMIREHELEITELQSIIATMQAQLTSLINGGQ